MDWPIIAPSAFKHGLGREDILHAYRNPLRIWDLGDGFTMMMAPTRRPHLRSRIRGRRRGDGDRPCHAGPRQVSQVMTMPRTVDEILQHADELAARFEDYEPDPADQLDPGAVALLRAAVQERSKAERHVRDAIKAARRSGMAWSAIGIFVGTTGEAARQRYGGKSCEVEAQAAPESPVPGGG